jgi:BirA family biotin operon repressor/biotin-[acetyl-CoA-carboxylase] ligase
VAAGPAPEAARRIGAPSGASRLRPLLPLDSGALEPCEETPLWRRHRHDRPSDREANLTGPASRPPWRILSFEEVTSTNETILAAGERGEPEWTVHLAERQSQGRGRASHSWWSPAGRGLWMSVLLRPEVPPSRIGGLALLTGLAVRRAVESLGAGPIDLYWPNDLQFGDRKIGGILGEVRRPQISPTGAVVALGIGLNIDLRGAQVPEELQGRVASLVEAGSLERDPTAIAGKILEHLLELYCAFQAGASIPALVGPYLSGMGREVRVRVPPAPSWPARTAGLGPEGELLLERSDGTSLSLRAGEVDYGP